MTMTNELVPAKIAKLLELERGASPSWPPTFDDLLLWRCELATWSGQGDRCRWCDARLPPRRRRWCSDFCAGEAVANHVWGAARERRLRMDSVAATVVTAYELVEARDGFPPPLESRPLERAVIRPPRRWYETRAICQLCGGSECANYAPQVHHRDVNANGYKVGCQHHLERLETLGHACHVAAHVALRERGQLRLV